MGPVSFFITQSLVSMLMFAISIKVNPDVNIVSSYRQRASFYQSSIMQDAAPSIIPLETSSTSIYVPMPTSRYNLKSAEGAARVSSWGGGRTLIVQIFAFLSDDYTPPPSESQYNIFRFEVLKLYVKNIFLNNRISKFVNQFKCYSQLSSEHVI